MSTKTRGQPLTIGILFIAIIVQQLHINMLRRHRDQAYRAAKESQAITANAIANTKQAVDTLEVATQTAKTAAQRLEQWVTNGLTVIEFRMSDGRSLYMQPNGQLTSDMMPWKMEL